MMPTARARRCTVSRAIAVSASVLGLLAAVLVLVVAVVLSHLDERRLGARLAAQLSSGIAGDVTIGAAHITFPATLRLVDLRAVHPKGTESLAVAEMHATLGLGALLHKTLHLHGVVVRDVRLGPTAPLAPEIDRIQLLRETFAATAPAAARPKSFADWSLEVEIESVTVAPGVGAALPPMELQAHVRWNRPDDLLQIRSVRLSTPEVEAISTGTIAQLSTAPQLDLEVLLPAARLTVSGAVPVTANGTLDLALTLDVTPPAPLLAVLGPQWSAAGAHVDATVRGSLERPRLAATLRAPGVDLDVEGSVADGRITGRLWGAADTSYWRFGVPTRGTVEILGTVIGPAQAPRIEMALSSADLVVADRALHKVTAQIAVERSGVQVTALRVLLDEVAGIVAHGTYDFSTHKVDATVRGSALPVDFEAHVVATRCDGSAACGGARHAIALTVATAQILAAGDTMTLVRPATLTYAGGQISVDALELAGTHTSLRAHGTLGHVSDVELVGHVSLALLVPFVSQMTRAQGLIEIGVRASGPIDGLAWTGQVEVAQPLGVSLRGLRREIVVTAGRLQVTPETLTVVGLTGSLGDGTFAVHGDVGLTSRLPSRYDLSLDAQDMPFGTHDLAFVSDLHLRATGTGLVPDLSGQLTVLRGRYVRKYALKDFIFVATPGARPLDVGQTYPWLSEMGLDLTLGTAEPVDVRLDAGGFRVDVAVEAKLRVRGAALAPLVEGRLAAVRGSVRFPSAELDVIEAVVDFSPGLNLLKSAAVHVRAEGVVEPRRSEADVTLVMLTLDGDLTRMALDITADPPLRLVEALVLLTTGDVLLSTDPAAGGVDDQQQLNAALGIAGSQLTQPLANVVAGGIERVLNVRPELAARVTASDVEVGVTQRLSSRLRLDGEFRQGYAGTGSVGTARAQVLLSDRLFVEGAFVSSTQVGIDGTRYDFGPSQRVELKLRLLGE